MEENEYVEAGYTQTFNDIVLLVMKSFGPYNPAVPTQQLFVSFIEELNKQYMLGMFTINGVIKMQEFIHQPERSDAYLDFINRLQIACSTVGFNEIELNNFLLATYNIMATDVVLSEAYKDILPSLKLIDKSRNIYSLTATYGLVHCYLLLYKVLVPYFYTYLEKEAVKLNMVDVQRRMQEDKEKVMRSITSEEE